MDIRSIFEQNDKAIIFGVTGQDGSYLADLLLSKGYEVVGVARRASTNTHERIKHLSDNASFRIVEGDITDYSSILNILNENSDVREVYNLAAQSHVGTSFKQPGLTWDVTGKGCMNILQAIVDISLENCVRFYQASSSEMYGASFDTKSGETLISANGPKYVPGLKYQDENTKHFPQSPYAIAKCAAHMSVRLYREAYGLHGSCGILFNHESPRRGDNFVTKKITRWIGDYLKWRKEVVTKKVGEFMDDHPDLIEYGDPLGDMNLLTFPKLRLGNLDARRDWGHAKDYVNAMWLMLQQDTPDDYVVCTGKTWSIREFLDAAFAEIGINDWEPYVVVDPEFYRPAEVEYLLGDCTKAETKLGWTRKYDLPALVKEMVQHEINEPTKQVSS